MSVQSQRDSESGKEMQTGRAGKQTLLRGERIGVCPGNVLLTLPNFHQAGSTENSQRPVRGSETPATPGQKDTVVPGAGSVPPLPLTSSSSAHPLRTGP